jgi:hypothetical protein
MFTEASQMTHDLPDEERDDEFMDENFEPGAPEEESASKPAGTSELSDIEPASVSGASGVNEPLEGFAEAIARPTADELRALLSPAAQDATAEDASRVLEKEITNLRGRAAELPSADDRPAIDIAVERRENMGRGRVEIGVHRPGEPGHAVKLVDPQAAREQSTELGAAAPPPTLPVGAGREELFRAPHVMVLVQLAESRSMLEDVVAEAGKRLTPDYRAIAEAEVKLGFWRQENQRRAADFRLRGPSW